MAVRYKLIFYIYDFLDIIYFNREQYSPRTALLSMLPNKQLRIADICAGTGSNSILIAKHRPDANITAIDLSKGMMNAANKKFKKAGVTNINALIADAADTGVPNCSYDVALLSFVLHEINEDLRKRILFEVRRLLKDDGCLYVVEWEQPKRIAQRIKFSFNKLMEPKSFKEYMRLDLHNYFREQGFTIAKKKSCDYSQVLELTKTQNV